MEQRDEARGKDQVKRHHGAIIQRGLLEVPKSQLYEGRFGRMFRNLPSLEYPPPSVNPNDPTDDLFRKLAVAMSEPEEEKPENEQQLQGQWERENENQSLNNPEIPAGYTYLGQFIDHDITFDPTSKLQRQNDPNAIRNFRTPRFDLDSVYGSGPADSPFMYKADGIRLLTGKNGAAEEDLPRNVPEDEEKRALIGDPRNDENVIVSQLQLAIIKFHNAVVGVLEGEGWEGEGLFEEARRQVRWHYQWIVVHDFLKTTVGVEVVNNILKPADDAEQYKVPKVDLKFFNWRYEPYMPVEFSAATYRFGHSQVRPSYKLNDTAPIILIFSTEDDPGDFDDLRGFRERPASWVIEWENFFKFHDSQVTPQPSRKIDTKLAFGLTKLPGEVQKQRNMLAELNLRRGKALGLPSGEAVARAMGLEPLSLEAGQANLVQREVPDWQGETPLWYYILRESEELAGGQHLGPVGGRIVAEVLLGLLVADPFSYLRVDPNWKPEPGKYGAREESGELIFGMPELLGFLKNQG